MGDPIECKHNETATGDTHQLTTTGLAFWRKVTHSPTFTNGWEHSALTPSGLVFWTGTSIDPPGIEVPAPPPAPPPPAQPVPAPTPTPVPYPKGWTPGPSATGSPRLRGNVDLSADISVPQYTPLTVFGWAANLDDPDSPGITAIHVYDGDASQGRILAAATLGQPRSDVAQALGDPRLAGAGFEVEIPTGGLARGTHTLNFYFQTRNNGWWQRSAEITVSAPAPRAKGAFIYGTHVSNPAASADLAKTAGFTHVWAYVPWRGIEPRRGEFLFKTETDWGETTPNDLTNVLSAAWRAGLKLVLRLDAPPEWAGGNVHRLNPADVERYVYEIVRYGGGDDRPGRGLQRAEPAAGVGHQPDRSRGEGGRRGGLAAN